MRNAVLTLIAVVTAAPAVHAQDWDQCRHEAQRSANVDAAGARVLEIDAGSGSLKIEGKAGLTRVVIRARACASDARLLDEIRLETSRSGNSVVVKANVRDSNNNWSYRDGQYARLDVVMEVPAGIAANIDDGSGSIDLSNLGAVDIDDGSGEIVADNLASIRIDDGSGAIRLVDIHGSVDIKDGSGGISLRNIHGPIDIDDGSGEINIRVARNSIRISDSSGSIDVANVDGDFVVDRDGSGSIAYDNVKGRVSIPSKKR